MALATTVRSEVNRPSGSGVCPLHTASSCGDASTVTELLDAGADVNVRTSQKQATPLHRSAHEGHAGVARLLLGRGASVNAQLTDGSTALHIAAQANHVAVAAVLLDAGADRSLVDGNGSTAFDKVSGSGNFALLQLLAPAQERAESAPQGGPQDDPVGVDPVPPVQPPVHADQECQFNGTLPGACDALAAEATTRRDAAAEMLSTQSPHVRAALDRFVACLARLCTMESTPDQCASGESTAELQAARAACVEAASALEVFPPDAVPYNDAVAAAVAAFDCEVEDFRSNASEIATLRLGDPCRASVVKAVKSLQLLVAAHDGTQASLAAEMDGQTDAFDGEAWATALNTGLAEAEAVLTTQTPWCGDDGLAEAQKRLRYRNATATKVTFRRREHSAAACNLDNKLPSEDSVALQQRRDEAADALAAAEERLAVAEASAREALLHFPGLTLEVAYGVEGAEGTAGAAACEAASAGKFDVLQDLLLRDPSLVETAEANGEPLLRHGIRSGDLDVVHLLWSFPAFRRSSDGTLAHELACSAQGREILELLVARFMALRPDSQTSSAASLSSSTDSDVVPSDVGSSAWNQYPPYTLDLFREATPRSFAQEESPLDTVRTGSDHTCPGAPVNVRVVHQGPLRGPHHTMGVFDQADQALPDTPAAVADAALTPATAPTASSSAEVAAADAASPYMVCEGVRTDGHILWDPIPAANAARRSGR